MLTYLLTDNNNNNNTLTEFIEGVAARNEKAAFDYRRRLESFRVFVLKK
jgi:hypothetical protein